MKFKTEKTPKYIKDNLKKLFPTIKTGMKPSMDARLDLIETGSKQIAIVGVTPLASKLFKKEMIEASKLAASYQLQGGSVYVDMPAPYSGWNRYYVMSKKTKEVLAVFCNDTPTLAPDSRWFNLHYLTTYNKDFWSGARSVNINPETGVINFENAGMTLEIVEPRKIGTKLVQAGNKSVIGGEFKKGEPRYCKYVIRKL